MFRKALYLIVITCLIFLIVGLYLPKTVHVERSVEIARPASTVFVLLNGFGTFSAWSPWSERDPETVYGYSGPVSGVGARMSWSGDPRLVGSGWQEITASTPWSLVGLQMQLDQVGKATSYYRIREGEDRIDLTWGFDMNLVEGQGFFSGLLVRYFGLFFDRWIGADFEAGLARFKAYAESFPAADFSNLEAEIVQAEPMDILYVTMGRRESAEGIAAGLASAFSEISALMADQSIAMQSQPMAITRAWDEANYRFDAAIPADTAGVELSGNVQAGKSPGGRAVRVVHRGPYDTMAESYAQLAAYMAVHGIAEGRVSWEQYVSDPGQTAPGETVTHIYFLIEDPARDAR